MVDGPRIPLDKKCSCVNCCTLYCLKPQFSSLPEGLSRREGLPPAVNVSMRLYMQDCICAHCFLAPFSRPKKTVLCLTRKFVSSWKNPFGSKWLDSVHTTKGYIVHFTSSPLSVVQKISLSPNPKSMLCFGRFQKGRPLLALVWIFALLQNFQISQFGLFPPLPPRHSWPDPWNVRENS